MFLVLITYDTSVCFLHIFPRDAFSRLHPTETLWKLLPDCVKALCYIIGAYVHSCEIVNTDWFKKPISHAPSVALNTGLKEGAYGVILSGGAVTHDVINGWTAIKNGILVEDFSFSSISKSVYEKQNDSEGTYCNSNNNSSSRRVVGFCLGWYIAGSTCTRRDRSANFTTGTLCVTLSLHYTAE